MTQHKQKKIYNPFYKESIEVDEKISSLLSSLWDKGYETGGSCEDANSGEGAGAHDKPTLWILFNCKSLIKMLEDIRDTSKNLYDEVKEMMHEYSRSRSPYGVCNSPAVDCMLTSECDWEGDRIIRESCRPVLDAGFLIFATHTKRFEEIINRIQS